MDVIKKLRKMRLPRMLKKMFEKNSLLLKDYYLEKIFRRHKFFSRLSLTAFSALLLLFLFISFLLPFKDKLFNFLYPKPASKAQEEMLPGFYLEGESMHIVRSEFPVELLTRTGTSSATVHYAKVQFPTSLVKISKIATGSSYITKWLEQDIDNEKGILILSGESQAFDASSSAKLATLFFTPQSTGSGSIKFDTASSIKLIDENINLVSQLKGLALDIVTTIPTAAPAQVPDVSTEPDKFSSSPSPVITPVTTATPAPVVYKKGDFNHDNKIDFSDLSLLVRRLNKKNDYLSEMDFNSDNQINIDDYKSMIQLLFDNKLIRRPTSK